jgi:4-amino-4-deoxy-L-arabinose transferase-like glycosyltransferase
VRPYWPSAWPWLALAALTLVRLAVAATMPVSPDEAYYRVWSRALADGYFDHPPMVALWIRAGTALAGDTALGIRLLAPLAAGAGSLLLAQATRDCLPGQRIGGIPAWVVAPALLNATLLLGAGAVTMTPDTPLLLFWTACLAALARLLRTGRGGWWLAAGLAAGLAMASKYTGLLLLPAAAAWLLITPGWRFWLLRPLPWGGVVTAALVVLPVVQWNAGHGWVSFLKQGGRTADWHPARAAQFLGELLAGQIGLATPLVAGLCACGAWAAMRRARRDPAAGLLAAFAVLPALVFVQHALGDRVQGNWPAILYPAAAIAAAGWCARWWRSATVCGLAITALVYLHATTGVLALPPRLDPTQRQLAGWAALSRAAAAAAALQGAGFIAADEYGVAAELALHLPAIRVIGAEPRWAYVALPAARIAGMPGLLLRSARHAGPPDASPDAVPWASVTPAGFLDRLGAGGVAERYLLYRVTGGPPAAGVVALPHGGDDDRTDP